MTKIYHDSATPAHGQQVISVCAFIHHDFNGVTKVFLPKRAETKQFLPGVYEFPGGHVDFGEDIVDGLKREIKEEIDMTIKVGDPFAAFTYKNVIKGSHSIEVIYFAKFIESIDKITINPEDHSRYDWFSLEEAIQHKASMTPSGQAIHKKGESDTEYQTLVKGFALLNGKSINYG